jgi:hypothetical protein
MVIAGNLLCNCSKQFFSFQAVLQSRVFAWLSFNTLYLTAMNKCKPSKKRPIPYLPLLCLLFITSPKSVTPCRDRALHWENKSQYEIGELIAGIFPNCFFSIM